MRAKENQTLRELATISGATVNQFSDKLIEALLSVKAIEDINDNWGATIGDAIIGDIALSVVVGALKRAGVPNKSVYIDAVMNLVLLGNGDCPECGGEIEVVDGEYVKTGGFDYDSEPEYTPKWEEKKCLNCGHRDSNEPDYEQN